MKHTRVRQAASDASDSKEVCCLRAYAEMLGLDPGPHQQARASAWQHRLRASPGHAEMPEGTRHRLRHLRGL